jgi:alkanesulfonate monooxygenase SsuD/methylene tetrahydromethanopterin reductase-like flavin-dependent oxidoreductase (luciferase family)
MTPTGAPDLFVRLPHSWCGADLDAIDAVARAAEDLGFTGVSVQDHLLSGHAVAPCGDRHLEDDRMVLEPFSVLSYVAARTSRVRLLTGVLVLPHRHPAWVAKTAATLDVLSRGRLTLGVGIGAPRDRRNEGNQNIGPHSDISAREHALIDVQGNRARFMDEALELLDLLWGEEAVVYEGERFRMNGVDMRPRPVQRPRPPIWVGGRAEAALRRAATLADGWFPSQATVEVMRAGIARVRELAAEAERPDPFFAVNMFVAVNRDGDLAREIVRDGLGHRFKGEEALFASTIAGSRRRWSRGCARTWTWGFPRST